MERPVLGRCGPPPLVAGLAAARCLLPAACRLLLFARGLTAAPGKRRASPPAKWGCHSWLRLLLVACCLLLAALCLLGAASAYTPESPEVRDALDRAVGFLESKKATDHRVGAKALVGMALIKHRGGVNHPTVIAAVQAIQDSLSGAADPSKMNMDIYSAGLSVIFLCTADPVTYAPEINALLKYLQIRQKPHGGWGYPQKETGDTSMTQYGVLSAWEAKHNGFRVPLGTIEGVTLWLLRTQDPSGAFGYQGKVSQNFVPVQQREMRPSMATAGLGSVYICANMLQMAARAREKTDLPPALKEVKLKEEEKAERVRTNIDARLVREVQARGNRWMAANYQINPPAWTHYYLYALERYWSFREAAEGVPEDAPNWYDDGVDFLLDTQADDGSWKSGAGLAADTSFAALFLLRSTKKSIERARSFGDGTLIGGRGLPRHTSRVLIRGGNVVAKPLMGTAQKLLAVMGDLDNPDHVDALEALAQLPPEEARTLVAKQADRLRELAGGASPEARLAAVRTLGKTRQLDHVPTLLYALTDPDPAVVRAARDSLRLISRKFKGFGLPDEPTEAELREAIKKWKAWYLAIRPDARLED